MTNPDGVFITYYWPKVIIGEPMRKTSYCLYIPELDIILGTGTYEVDVQALLKNNTFLRLQSYYTGSGNYIFIIGHDGNAHVFGDATPLKK